MLNTRLLLAPLLAIGCLSPLAAQDVSPDTSGCPHNVLVQIGKAGTTTANQMDCGSVQVSINGVSGSQTFEGCPAVIRIYPDRWRVDTDHKSGKVARKTHDLKQYTIINSCESWGFVFTFWRSCEVKRTFVSNYHPQYRLDACTKSVQPADEPR